MNFQVKYELFRAYFERVLGETCEAMDFEPKLLAESMRYSLLAGGKRIRPVLFLATLDLFGLSYTEEINLAVALECIHTYSLIHDDLPAMDNDDYRRGRLSNHKVFGEANAILAGDGLLSYAFDLLLQEAGRDARHLTAARILSEAAGVHGMVAGQSADLLAERSSEKFELEFIHRNKTARMITAPLAMAATLAAKYEDIFAAFGDSLGMLFQITDDILDENGIDMGKTLGKDKVAGKRTAVSEYGLQAAQALADSCAKNCLAQLATLHRNGFDIRFLEGIVELVRTRTN